MKKSTAPATPWAEIVSGKDAAVTQLRGQTREEIAKLDRKIGALRDQEQIELKRLEEAHAKEHQRRTREFCGKAFSELKAIARRWRESAGRDVARDFAECARRLETEELEVLGSTTQARVRRALRFAFAALFVESNPVSVMRFGSGDFGSNSGANERAILTGDIASAQAAILSLESEIAVVAAGAGGQVDPRATARFEAMIAGEDLEAHDRAAQAKALAAFGAVYEPPATIHGGKNPKAYDGVGNLLRQFQEIF